MTKRKGFAIGLAVSQAMIILPLLFWLLQHTPAAYAADWNVNIFADVSDGDCEDGSCSLRDAINLAAALDTIYLPAGSYTLTLGEISTGKTITLIGQGAGAADTIIDGNFASRLFSISSGTVTFSNLTLQNGQPASGSGGAISATGTGSITLDNSVITNNVSLVNGGGINLAGGTLNIINGSKIVSNTAVAGSTSTGGGVYANQATVNLTDSTIAYNSAQSAGGIFLNQANAQLTINNGQILNNNGLAALSTSFPGGGIAVGFGSVVMNSGLISGNTAFRGAGALINSGSFTLNGGTITDNESNYGGGFYVRNPAALLTVNAGAISGNRSVATIFGGGALYIFQGSAVQNGGEINDNTAVNLGGAMEVRQGSFVMNGGTISGNSAGNLGGAIYNDMGTITITNGTLSANSSLQGGGAIATGATSQNEVRNSVIYTNSTSITQTGGAILNTGTLTLSNVTLSNNFANNGGGLQNEGTATLTNVTIYQNTAVSNGGGLNTNGGSLTIVNSIVAGNSATIGPDCAGTLLSQGFNLIQNSADCTISGSTTGNVSGDPLLAALALNGGSTLNHALGSSSPALDAGDNTSCAATDQRNVNRPVDGDGNATATCDIGAFEYGIQIEIGDARITEGDSGSVAALFTVTRSLQTSGTDTLEYATITNTATTDDFTAVPSTTLIFNPGDITKTISIDVTGDTVDETDETFFVQLGNPSAGLFFSRDSGSGTIVDDDSEPKLTIADTLISEGDSGTKSATFTVTLSAASASTVLVNYVTSDETAVAGTDYVSASNSLTFTPGDTEEIISITVNGDSMDEDDETFRVTLSSPSNATITDGTAQGTINNDDAPPTLSIADSSLSEGDDGTNTTTFTVTLSAISGKTVEVDFDTMDDTAVAPTDYLALSGSLTFIPGDSEEIISITVNGDRADEDAEAFFVNLSGESNATIADGQAIGTIDDDDEPPELSINNVTITEGNSGSSHGIFTVALDEASSKTVAVNFATLAGSATAGTDYTMVSDLITITAGSISETITIPITGDALDEDDETLSVVLSSPVNATLSANSQGQATITDDDDPPAISIEDVTVTEGDSGTTTAVFTIGLTKASGKIIVVSINSSDITATAGQDYTAVSTSRAFNPGDPLTQTISVAITGDKSSEEDETFWLTLSNPGNVTLAKSQAIGTILDDDGVFLFLPFITSP